MSEHIKVDTAALEAKAGEINGIQVELTSLMNELTTKVTSLNNSWESPEASSYQAKFNKAQNDIEAVLKLMNIRARNIVRAAEAYNEGFREVAINIDEIPNAPGVPVLQ